MSRVWIGCAFAAALSLAGVSNAVAQPSVGASSWEQARDLYRTQQYEQAIPLAIEAIQADPTGAIYYVGLARLYFQTGDYDRAVFYYDLYLNEMVVHLTEPIEERYQPSAVMAERQAAAPYATGTDIFASQTQIRTSVEQRLLTGPVITPTGGGAWSDYQALLRSGYARPDLTDLRVRLRAELVAEAARVVDPPAAEIPPMTSEQWDSQCSRLRGANELDTITGPMPGTQGPSVVAMQSLCRGQTQFLNLNYELAATEFRAAIAADADMLPAYMGLLNSMYQLSWNGLGDSTEWQEIVTGLEQRIAARELDMNIVAIYRAAFESQAGELDSAVRRIGGILGIPQD